MHRNKARNKTLTIIGLAVVAVGLIAVAPHCGGGGLGAPDTKPVFNGDSNALIASEIVPTLDAPIREGVNTIWCASFLAAWKTLETDLVGQPLLLQGNPQVALSLAKADDPRPHIPTDSLYTAAGWTDKGIIEQIANDLAAKFPAKAPPTFPELLPGSLVAYAYLEANVKFSIPYFQNRKPLVFTDRAGNKTELSSFGIRREDDYAYYELREQPAILFVARDEEFNLTECVIDLDTTSQPNQIILAMIEPGATLAETLAIVEDRIEAEKREIDGAGPNDVLVVPDMVWRITHRYAELEGQKFANSKLSGMPIVLAMQDIQFRLDRNGVELRSESKLLMLPVPTLYIFDRPFLLYMTKRGAEKPYFAMWIDNAELLNKWQPVE